MQGVTEQAELLGGDALDALNLPLHFRRKPIGTSAILAGAAMFLVSRFTRQKTKKVGRPGRPSPWVDIARSIVGSTLASALTSKGSGLAGLSGFKRYSR